jgi:hypothetical protein
MKNLQTPPANCPKQQQTMDGSLSRLFLGFLERKISPQTIADILRVQISESHVFVDEFHASVCNGILESLTYANSTEDCSDLIFYFSEHTEFPGFLSHKATLGTLRSLLHHIADLIKRERGPVVKNMDLTLEKLSEHLLDFVLNRNEEDRLAMAELGILSKNVYPAFIKFMNNTIHFQHLCFLLRSRQSFQEEGFFHAESNHESLEDYRDELKKMIENFDQHPFLIRNVILGIQKDLCFLFERQIQEDSEKNKRIYKEARKISQSIFHYLVSLYKKDKTYVTKFISSWAMEIPVAYEQARFLSRMDWRWIRTLAEHIWDDSLKEPPFWVVEKANTYCALIFHCAPAQWLQKYSLDFLDPLYQKALENDFYPTAEHYHYVEFLLRNLRKKSPFIATHSESLYALSLLNHLTQSESIQYEAVRFRFEESNWKKPKNPIAGALEVMMDLVRETTSQNISES